MIYRLHFEISKVYVSLIANISYSTLIFPRVKSNPGPFFRKKGGSKSGVESMPQHQASNSRSKDIFVQCPGSCLIKSKSRCPQGHRYAASPNQSSRQPIKNYDFVSDFYMLLALFSRNYTIFLHKGAIYTQNNHFFHCKHQGLNCFALYTGNRLFGEN